MRAGQLSLKQRVERIETMLGPPPWQPLHGMIVEKVRKTAYYEHGSGLSESETDALYLRLDCANDPLTADLDVQGNVNLGKAGAQYEIESDLALKLEDTAGARTNVIMGQNADAVEAVGDEALHDSVLIGKDVCANGTRYADASESVVIGSGAAGSLEWGSGLRGVVIGYQAANASTSHELSVVVGYQAAYSDTVTVNPTSSVIIGAFAGYDANVSAASASPDISVIIGYQAAMRADDTDYSVIIGYNAATEDSGGSVQPDVSSSVILGGDAAADVQYGYDSVTIGAMAGTGASGAWNVLIGYSAADGVGDGSGFDVQESVGIGYYAFDGVTTSITSSIGVGASVGGSAGEIDGSVILGYEACYESTSVINSVIIGYQAGYGFTASNVLIIENSSDISTPLIYGEFDNDLLRINGDVEIVGQMKTVLTNGSTASPELIFSGGDVILG